jgi:hypothetical protein
MRTRPSGSRRGWAQLSTSAALNDKAFAETGKRLADHHEGLGSPAALHVAEIQAWMVAAFEGVGRRCGERFVMSST